jgi:hypothetical protein
MSTALEIIDLSELEENSFMLFKRNLSEQYMRMVIYQTLINIQRYEGIRLTRLIWEFERIYQIPEDDVRSAVGALSSPYTLNTIFVSLQKKDNVSDAYLKAKPNSDELIKHMLYKQPMLKNFKPLLLNKA